MLTVTDVSTTCAVVTFRVKVSCITSVDGIYSPLVIDPIDQLRREVRRCHWSFVSEAVMLLAVKTRYVIGAFRSVYCHGLAVVYC